MLRQTTESVTSFVESLPSRGDYLLAEVRLDVPDPVTIMFRAKLRGPDGLPVWARAWVSSETDGTLAEAASTQLTAGDDVTLTIRLTDRRRPDHAHLRIESAPLQTEHVVSAALS